MGQTDKSDDKRGLRLLLGALPEIIRFHIIVGILIVGLGWVIDQLIDGVVLAGGGAITTANLAKSLMNWRTPVLLVLIAALAVLFVVLELFAQIYMCDDILTGRVIRMRALVRRSFAAVGRFANPWGVVILLYIVVAASLYGLGFSASQASGFYLPTYAIDAIFSTPLYIIAYCAVMALLFVVGLFIIFTLHAVLLDGKKPGEGLRFSTGLFRKHWKRFLPGILAVFLLGTAAIVAAYIVTYLPGMGLDAAMADLPKGYVVDSAALLNATASRLDYRVTTFRFLSLFVTVFRTYVLGMMVMLLGTVMIMWVTRRYRAYTGGDRRGDAPRADRQRHGMSILVIALTLTLMLIGCTLIAVYFNDVLMRDEPVYIVAHRTGGVMASENSLEGVAASIEKGCYGCETDVQRTGDGGYIINHDEDFRRLTGVRKKPGEMTMAEIAGLRIKDTTGSGAELSVPTAEEMLLAIRGKAKLFLELKGVSADRRMADDMVSLIRKLDCADDIVFISLQYDVIDYVKKTYPEFETGVLMFGGIGDISRLNCDLLIMEEHMATADRIDQIHSNGKKAYVWTVNTREGLHHFLNSDADGVITDQIELAMEVQAELDARTDYDIIIDKFDELWEG